MTHNTLSIAKSYYTAISEKNLTDVETYLHPDVRFISPVGEQMGKEAFLKSVKTLTTLFKTLTIRAMFDTEDQAMLAYDLDFHAPIGNVRTAALLTFQKELIIKIELFFDARPFDK